MFTALTKLRDLYNVLAYPELKEEATVDLQQMSEAQYRSAFIARMKEVMQILQVAVSELRR